MVFPRALAGLCGLMLALSGCAAILPPGPPAEPRLPLPPAEETLVLPPMKQFTVAYPLAPQRSNTEIGRDYLDLMFRLETGETLPVLSRFEGPITVTVAGGPRGATLDPDLDRLLRRLRREGGIDIRRVPDGQTASITIVPVSEAELRRTVPSAACFVVPARVTWAEFRRRSRQAELDWRRQRVRQAATVFIPGDASPQEIRDCLHEEIAQALGPLNDLYRLEDSVFNDDNLHSVLTGFDMLVLKITYDPALQSGMTRDQVAARLPAVLARQNPQGEGLPTRPFQPTPRAWINDVERALGPSRSNQSQAATRALTRARQEGWNDTRLGLSYMAAARVAADRVDPVALDYYLRAAEVYDARPATRIHAAHAAVQLAAFALAAEQWQTALNIADEYIPAAIRGENAALLADLYLVQATALSAQGRTREAEAARRDSLAWGQYGFGSPALLRGRAAEITSLGPADAEGGQG
ncbi:MAG: DUF2927 domain-containing protein [Pseudomonadota bacterium]